MEGDGVDDSRPSLTLTPSREDGEAVARGAHGPPAPRPFTSFSLDRWEAGGVREGVRRGEGEEMVRRTCDAASARLRQGIFSRLTTGRDTLQRGRVP